MAANPVPPVPELECEIDRTPSETIVRCRGKLTLETCALFQDTIRSLIVESKSIVVDLTNVQRVDSAGLGALVSVWSSSKKQSAELAVCWPDPHAPSTHRELRLANFSGPVRKLLQLTRLDKVFGVRD